MLDLRAFIALQEKARRHLPPHASLRRATLAVSAGLVANRTMESQKQFFKSTGVMNQNYETVSAVLRGVVQESQAVSEETKNMCCNS